jgi:N utilization substance protein B
MKTAKRQAREVALQALYAWQLSQADALEQMAAVEGFEDADRKLAEEIVRGVRDRAGELQEIIAPCLDRAFEKLSPVERAILYIGSFELRAHPRTPFKVVINEAIELGKSYGGNEGHRFVNGVLEKIAAALRPDEVARASKIA